MGPMVSAARRERNGWRVLAALCIALAGACGGDAGGAGSAAGAAAAGGSPGGRRLLVVGWDGATFDLLDPLVRAGRLPNLGRLMERGTSARLESTVVPISSAAWAAAVTGRGPGGTGVYSFFESVPGTYDVRLISSHSNHATPLWRLLARRGLSSVVWGVPGTYPPEPIPGVLVAGMLSPQDAVYTHPPALTERLRQRGFVPDLGMWRSDRPIRDPARVHRQLRLKQEALLEVLADESWSLAWVVYKSLDVLSHAAYDGDPGGAVAGLCVELDQALGELVQAVGPETDVLLISDHGFRAYRRYFDAFGWLMSEGFAVPNPRVVPPPVPAGPLSEQRAALHHSLMKTLDLGATRVLVTKAEGHFGGFRFNVRGREPEGCVAPGEAEALEAQVEAALARLEAPGGGSLLRRTWRGRELYPGRFAERLPDLLFETDPSVVVFSNRPMPAILGSLDGIYPDHDRPGVFVAAGPGIRRAGRLETDLSILDIAPLALALLGQPAYQAMEGEARGDVLVAGTVPARVREADDPPDGLETLRWLRSGSELDDDEREELLRRMAELGYTE